MGKHKLLILVSAVFLGCTERKGASPDSAAPPPPSPRISPRVPIPPTSTSESDMRAKGPAAHLTSDGFEKLRRDLVNKDAATRQRAMDSLLTGRSKDAISTHVSEFIGWLSGQPTIDGQPF